MLFRRIGAAVLAMAALAGSCARAQDYGRLAPKPAPAENSAVPAVAPAPAASASNSNLTVEPWILYKLKGLRLVDKATKVAVNGSHATGVTVDGPTLLYDRAILQRLADTYVGKPLSAGAMQRLQAQIADWYKDHDRPFVDVSFPEQDISTGVLQVVVTELRRGRLRTVGNEWFQNWLIRAQIGVERGGIIDPETLNADIAWLNENPFRQTYAVLDRTGLPGTIDVVLHTDNRFPLRVYATYDNTGVPAEGASRYGAGFVWGNALFLDQILSYQFTSSDDFFVRPTHISVGDGKTSLAAHSLSDTILLPWHDKLVFFGLYEEDRPPLGVFLSQLGISWQASFRYDAKFTPLWGMAQELQAGADFKRTNNNFAFGGFNISHSETDIVQFPIQYTLSQPDSWGQTSFTNLAVFSPGKLTPFNTNAAFQPAPSHFGTSDARARYAYDDMTMTRVNKLPWDFSAYLRVEGQFATGNLLPSEQLDAGGLDSVRGYDTRTASGSLGALGTAEIRTPPFGPLDLSLGSSTGDAMQFDAFTDYGYVRDNQTPGALPIPTQLLSVGGGVHYTLNRYIDFRFENGWQLRRVPGARTRGSRLIFSVVVGN